MKKKIIFTVLWAILSNGFFAQDLEIQNPNQSLLYLNPSFAGSNGGLRLQNSYMNRWPNLNSRIISFNSCFDMYIKPIKGAFALSYARDDFERGVLVDQKMDLIYAHYFELKERKLKIIPSIEISYLQKNLDVKSLTFGQAINAVPIGSEVLPNSSKQNIDFSSGLILNYKTFYGGVTVKHFTQPDMGLSGVNKLPTLINIHAANTYSFNQKSNMQFYLCFTQQATYRVVSININATVFKNVLAGIGYQNRDNVFFNLGYRNNYFSILLGQGIAFNRLAGNTGGLTTLSIALSLRNLEQRKALRNFENW